MGMSFTLESIGEETFLKVPACDSKAIGEEIALFSPPPKREVEEDGAVTTCEHLP